MSWALAISPFFDSHGNVVGAAGILESVPVFGGRPEWSTRHGRIVLSIIVVISLVSAISVICSGNHKQLADQPPDRVSWRSLLAILLPFLVAYLFLLMPRATSTGLYDRYLLPILIVTVLLAVRYYQDYVRPTLPFTSLALVALAAATSVAGTHDLFAMFRSTLIAANEVNASGVPRRDRCRLGVQRLTELNTTGWVLPNRTVFALKDCDIPQARAVRPAYIHFTLCTRFAAIQRVFRTECLRGGCRLFACNLLDVAASSKGDDLRRKEPYRKLNVKFIRQFSSQWPGPCQNSDYLNTKK